MLIVHLIRHEESSQEDSMNSHEESSHEDSTYSKSAIKNQVMRMHTGSK